MWVDVVVYVVIALCIVFFIRFNMVARCSTRLLNEEYDWAKEHWTELREGKRRWGVFERYMRLPPYEVMVFKFWRSMGSFERELGPVEPYYPLVEEGENEIPG